MAVLNWQIVKERYRSGTLVRTLVGANTFEITEVTDEAIHFRWRLVEGTIKRRDLERIVDLIEQGVVRPDKVTLTSDYRTLVTDERPTTAAALLQDLGYLGQA
jgi:hypothetical protein